MYEPEFLKSRETARIFFCIDTKIDKNIFPLKLTRIIVEGSWTGTLYTDGEAKLINNVSCLERWQTNQKEKECQTENA